MFKLIATLLILLGLFTAPLAAAQTTTNQQCQPIYGGGETCSQAETFSVNLQIKNPQTSQYVENLTAANPNHTPNQTVMYKLIIKNVTKDALSKGTVTIVFPQDVTYVSGTGTFDQKNRKLTFPIDKLNGTETKVFFITGKVVTKPQKNNLCTFTQALGTFANKTSQDNTQFCIGTTTAPKPAARIQQATKGGLAIYPPSTTKQTPETGPEALALIGLIPTGALGVWLRRKR